MSPASTLGTFILVFLLVFGLIVLYNKVAKGSTKVLECKNNGGQCVDGTCDFGKQIPALSDKAAGCGSGQICCINVTNDKPKDPDCENLKPGAVCGANNYGYCDYALQCVSKCTFCATNAGQEYAKTICKDKFDFSGFSCQCTGAECTAEMMNKGKCIPNYCPSSTPADTDFACCKRS